MLPTTLTHNDIVYYNIKYPLLSRGIAEIFCHFTKKVDLFSECSRKVCKVVGAKRRSMFAAQQGWRGRSPSSRKDDVILRAWPQAFSPEGSRAAPIYKGGAVPVRWSLMWIIVELKLNRFVSTYYSQHKRNYCVIFKVHSDFPFSYIFSFLVLYRPLRQHRAARGTTRSARDPSAAGGLRTPPQDDIVSDEGGCAPFTPALRVRTYPPMFCFLTDCFSRISHIDKVPK